jgi:hypothetical protein
MANRALIRPVPSTVTIAIAKSRLGNAINTSIIRINRLSSQPPTVPAIAPIKPPRKIAKLIVTKPTCNDNRLP